MGLLEPNPGRAATVVDSVDDVWSSYRADAQPAPEACWFSSTPGCSDSTEKLAMKALPNLHPREVPL
jgi:hypothetical protein